MMYYAEDDGYYVCPDCGSEFWNFSKEINSNFVRQDFEKNLPITRGTFTTDTPMPKKARKIGGGGSRSRKKTSDKKQKLEKPTTQQLYERMVGKSETKIGFVKPESITRKEPKPK
jgi:hypothetical protein